MSPVKYKYLSSRLLKPILATLLLLLSPLHLNPAIAQDIPDYIDETIEDLSRLIDLNGIFGAENNVPDPPAQYLLIPSFNAISLAPPDCKFELLAVKTARRDLERLVQAYNRHLNKLKDIYRAKTVLLGEKQTILSKMLLEHADLRKLDPAEYDAAQLKKAIKQSRRDMSRALFAVHVQEDAAYKARRRLSNFASAFNSDQTAIDDAHEKLSTADFMLGLCKDGSINRSTINAMARLLKQADEDNLRRLMIMLASGSNGKKPAKVSKKSELPALLIPGHEFIKKQCAYETKSLEKAQNKLNDIIQKGNKRINFRRDLLRKAVNLENAQRNFAENLFLELLDLNPTNAEIPDSSRLSAAIKQGKIDYAKAIKNLEPLKRDTLAARQNLKAEKDYLNRQISEYKQAVRDRQFLLKQCLKGESIVDMLGKLKLPDSDDRQTDWPDDKGSGSPPGPPAIATNPSGGCTLPASYVQNGTPPIQLFRHTNIQRLSQQHQRRTRNDPQCWR